MRPDPAMTAALLTYFRKGGTITKCPTATPEWLTAEWLARTEAERFFARVNRAPYGRRIVRDYIGK